MVRNTAGAGFRTKHRTPPPATPADAPHVQPAVSRRRRERAQALGRLLKNTGIDEDMIRDIWSFLPTRLQDQLQEAALHDIRTPGGWPQMNSHASMGRHCCMLNDLGLPRRADRELVLEVVAQNALALGGAAMSLRNNKEVVLTAVARNGDALKFASLPLTADPEVVLTAVASNVPAYTPFGRDGMPTHGWHSTPFRHAAQSLRNNREVVLLAVALNGLVLPDLPPSSPMQADKEVVVAAIATNPSALRFAVGGVGKTKLLEESARRKGQP